MGNHHQKHPLDRNDGSRTDSDLAPAKDPRAAYTVSVSSPDRPYRHLLMNGPGGIRSIRSYPSEVNGKPGMVIGCTWFNVEVVRFCAERLGLVVAGPWPVEPIALVGSAAAPAAPKMVGGEAAEVVTSLPRRVRAGKVPKS